KFVRRNKAALAMASVIGLALLLVVGSLGWVVRDREVRRARAAVEGTPFLPRGEAHYADKKLPGAAAPGEKAGGVLEVAGGDADLRRRVRQWLTDVDMAAKLEELRLQFPDIAEPDQLYADYARLFREYGIDVEALSVEETVTRIAGSQIRFELTVALNTWAWRLRVDPRLRESARWQHLRAISQASDPDPWRRRLTSAAHAKDLKTLRAVAGQADLGQLHARNLAHLGSTLTFSGDPDAGVAVLRQAQRQHPGDFLINSD